MTMGVPSRPPQRCNLKELLVFPMGSIYTEGITLCGLSSSPVLYFGPFIYDVHNLGGRGV